MIREVEGSGGKEQGREERSEGWIEGEGETRFHLAKNVKEKCILRQVGPVVVAEGAGEELPPLGVGAVEVEGLRGEGLSGLAAISVCRGSPQWQYEARA